MLNNSGRRISLANRILRGRVRAGGAGNDVRRTLPASLFVLGRRTTEESRLWLLSIAADETAIPSSSVGVLRRNRADRGTIVLFVNEWFGERCFLPCGDSGGVLSMIGEILANP